MIAGDRPIGLGWLVGGMDGPGDGTVALDDDGVSNLIEVDKRGRGAQHDLVSSLFDLARRKIEVGVPNGLEDSVQGKAYRHDQVRIQFDPDLALPARAGISSDGSTPDSGPTP